jgi:hypothetical protein
MIDRDEAHWLRRGPARGPAPYTMINRGDTSLDQGCFGYYASVIIVNPGICW